MATLVVRGLPDAVLEMLGGRAARQGVTSSTLVTAVLAESAAELTTEEWLAGLRARRAATGNQPRADGPAPDLDVAALLDDVREDYDPW